MRHGFLFLLLVMTIWTMAGCFAASSAVAEPTSMKSFNADEVKKLMGNSEGCFVAYDPVHNQYFRYNEAMCRERISPYSTFKIFNSLAGLESGFVKDADFLLPWDGVKSDLVVEWNHDHTLRSAVQNSVVWYFRKVATGVGAKKMQAYLKAADYGNEDISGGLTEFWISSSLKISPDEQVNFLRKLCSDTLPFSKRSTAMVKDIIKVKTTDLGVLRGKTGSSYKDGRWVLGWFVGYVEHDGQPLIFATCMRGDGARGANARAVSESILKSAKLL